MARKLNTYQASVGFFDLAIAAPSMKAALEAWGSNSNLFHQGVAKESSDPKVIAAAMSKPGVILWRPVGSNGPFKQHAQLPSDLPADEVKSKPVRQRPQQKTTSPQRSTIRQAARRHSRSRKSSASVKASAGRKKAAGPSSASNASEQSPRWKQGSQRPSENMMREQAPLKLSARRSKNARSGRTRAGRRRNTSRRSRCAGHEAEQLSRRSRLNGVRYHRGGDGGCC
jgi:colicin import membrane protein